MPNQDLGEEAISKAAEAAMSTQLDEKEGLDVDVHTDPGKVMQGELDAVEIDGDGLVMNKDLRTEELNIQTDRISINPFKAAFGEIELERPTAASARVVLKDSDLERAFNSDYIQDKFKDLKIDVDGQSTTVKPKNVQFALPGNGKIALSSDVDLVDMEATKHVGFSATPTMKEGGHQVTLENVQHHEGKYHSPELTNALIESAQELLDLRNFELEGMTLKFQQLDVQQGQITLQAKTRIEQFPSE
ncbi:MAG: DUF2993 domain-containing protein [Cyanophyceae cyanobacterium]